MLTGVTGLLFGVFGLEGDTDLVCDDGLCVDLPFDEDGTAGKSPYSTPCSSFSFSVKL